MYYAEKDGRSCRIPESKKAAYEFMGYKCTEIKPDVKKSSKAQKESKPAEKAQ
ncbi:MAG: hypothetical protein ACI4EO_01625 [Blautia sp.]